MTDIFSRAKRSAIMSRIRSTGTSPEVGLFALVRDTLGHRWRVLRNVRSLPGQPDVFIPELRLVIFADGCFYHGCPIHGHTPKSNPKYWRPKLRRNKTRDGANRRALRRMGIGVWRFWEHDLKGTKLKRTRKTLTSRLQARLLLHTVQRRKPVDKVPSSRKLA